MIKVRLSGGVGNQLFQYYEGARISIEKNESLIIDFRDTYLGKTRHSSSITSFTLPVSAEFINLNPGYISTVIRKVFLSLRHKAFSIRRSPEVVKNSLAVPEQNWKNFYFVDSQVNAKLELSSPSSWYLSESAAIQSESVIAIHIRRGDYTLPRNRNTIGVLDKSYYAECLKLACDEVGKMPIWVFSDSHGIADEFQNVFPPEARFIQPPLNADPAESIALMSLARILIISNSTFSWWAACLSKKSTTVYSPIPWFKNLEQPEDLLIESWNLVGSKWKIYEDE